MNPTVRSAIIALIFIGVAIWFFQEQEVAESARQVQKDEDRAKVPAPEVKSIPKPEKKDTSGKEGSDTAPEPDTNWDKDGDGKVDEGFTGVKRTYWDESKKNLRDRITFQDGKKNGPTKCYFKSGKLNYEAFYKDGLSHGNTKIYFKSGNIRNEEPAEYGLNVGPNILYYEDGPIRMKYPGYGNGQNATEGNFYYYDKSGTLTKQILYDGKGGSMLVFDLERGIDKR